MNTQPYDLKAQENGTLEIIGKWSDGPSFSLAIQDQKALLGSGTNIVFLDISDPQNPIEILKYETGGVVYDIFIEDKVAFIALDNHGLLLLDITDFEQPEEKSFLKIWGYRPNFVLHDQWLYYSTNKTNGLDVIDISDLDNPLTTISLPYSSEGKMEIHGEYLFMSAGWDGFVIFDIRDPSNPLLISTMDDFYAYDLSISSQTAFVAAADSLLIIDISDPLQPIHIASIQAEQSWSITKVFLHNNILYTLQYDWIKSYDISSIETPQLIMNYKAQSNDSFLKCLISGDHFYAASGADGLLIFDISDPMNPQESAFFNTADYSTSIALKDHVAFVANNLNGIILLDISDPSTPVYLKKIKFGDLAQHIKIMDNKAYVLDRYHGLFILDISDVENPVLLNSIDLGSGYMDFQISDQKAFIARYSQGFTIVDIADPMNMSVIGQYDHDYNTLDLVIKEDYAFIAVDDGGFRVLDISDPSSIEEVAYLDDIGSIRYLSLHGNVLCAGNKASYSRFIDITHPQLPVERSKFYSSRSYNTTFKDNLAYISAGFKGLYILDISDLDNPLEIASHETPGRVKDIFLYKDTMYIADDDAGIIIARFDTLSSSNRPSFIYNDFNASIIPNPINSSSYILFNIKEPGKLCFTLHEISGKLIGQSQTEYFHAGKHHVKLSDLTPNDIMHTPGIYFLRINSENASKTLKLSVL